MTSSRSDPVVPAPKVNYLDPTTKEALKLLFAPEGSFIQELILTEVKVLTWMHMISDLTLPPIAICF